MPGIRTDAESTMLCSELRSPLSAPRPHAGSRQSGIPPTTCVRTKFIPIVALVMGSVGCGQNDYAGSPNLGSVPEANGQFEGGPSIGKAGAVASGGATGSSGSATGGSTGSGAGSAGGAKGNGGSGGAVSTGSGGTSAGGSSGSGGVEDSGDTAASGGTGPGGTTESGGSGGAAGNAFVHPGLLHTAADFSRMQANYQKQPWVGSWDKLIANAHSQTTWTPKPVATVIRGGTGQNYGALYEDIAAAYQSALRYKISGDPAYADQSIRIMNAWSSTMTTLTGDADRFLASGIYGYEFCQAAEIMRDYSGWSSADFAKFKNLMQNVFYPLQHDFLVNHNGACITNYWANWDLSNIAGIAAIGVLCDDPAKYDEALSYFKTGAGNGQIDHSIPFTYSGSPTLGQGQEEGRDQGHSGLDVSLWGVVCQQFYNQGDDMFAWENSKVLAASEYFAKYNAGGTVPFTTYKWGTAQSCTPSSQTIISANSRGDQRPVWDLIYNHYQVLKGIPAPNSAAYAASVRPDGGGGDYGPNSGGYDQLGYTTLTCTLPAAGQ